MTRLRLALPLLVLLAACASEREGWDENHVLAGLDYGEDGVSRAPRFEPPPPLEPQVIDGTPETVKPAWKTPPQRVTSLDPTTGLAVSGAGGSSLDVQAAIDVQEQEVRAREAQRRAVRRAAARERGRETKGTLRRQERERKARFDEAREALEKRQASEVQSIIDDLRRVCGKSRPGVIEAKAKDLVEAMRERADRFGLRAARARRDADVAGRFAHSTDAQGVTVQGSLRDAQRAERRAVDQELEALTAEAEAHWAALAQRRILRGQFDSPH